MGGGLPGADISAVSRGKGGLVQDGMRAGTGNNTRISAAGRHLPWTSCCGKIGSAMSWQHQEADSISGLAQGVKDPVLLHLRHRSQMWLRSGVAVAVV